MHWLLVALGVVIGWLLLPLSVFAMAWVLHCLHRDEKIRLRVALGDLMRAVEGERVDRQSEFLKRALDRARDVLSGKGAE